MRYLFALALIISIASCGGDKPFINHKLTYQVLKDCTGDEPKTPIRVLSNIAGERYEIDGCFDSDFDGKNYTVKRQGDTVLVDFPKTSAAKKMFKLTLDIDARPAYKLIIIDGREIRIQSYE